MNTIDHIFYINLDHRTDRRAEIEQELEGLGVTVERFPAIYTETMGHLGCALSHLGVARLAKERGYRNVLVFEDDFQFTVSKEEFKKEMQSFFDSIPNFDVCLLLVLNEELKDHNEHCMKVLKAQNMGGYIVNEKYLDTHISLLERSAYMYKETFDLQFCCDVIWHMVMPEMEFYTFKKSIGIQRKSYSDISKAVVDPFTKDSIQAKQPQ